MRKLQKRLSSLETAWSKSSGKGDDFHGGEDEDPELSALKRFEEYRLQLIEVYKKHNPAMLDQVDSTLREWQGREEELFSLLAEKYEKPLQAIQAAKEEYNKVVDGLKKIYHSSLRPIEELYKFDLFFSPLLEDADIEAKPIVLLIGPYSVGKTSFIRHLIQRDFPGIRIGPEPTTDKFTCIMHGEHDQVIPGNALCVAADRPFRGLNKYGTSFLNRMEGSLCNSKLLETMTLVDTPGVLSGEKQRIGRQYNFTEVIEWFASRADRIILLFDAHKLDISDELKRCIEALKGHDDKIRVVLNKSDSISSKKLMRVYGALMWSLGKVVRSPEVLRVYISSFGKPLDKEHDNYRLFESEAADLISDLKSLPRNSAVRKVNELVKRARLAKVHAHIIAHLKSQMPSWFGKSSKQKQILESLPEEFLKVSQKFRLPVGDFPDLERFKAQLTQHDLSKFPKLSERALSKLDNALTIRIPELMKHIQAQTNTLPEADGSAASRGDTIRVNPFDDEASTLGMDSAFASLSPVGQWKVSLAEKSESDNIFYDAALTNGKLGGAAARQVLLTSGLQNEDLYKIWQLADMSKTNQLDADEFAVCMHLVRRAQRGEIIPDSLPPDLIPPSKRI